MDSIFAREGRRKKVFGEGEAYVSTCSFVDMQALAYTPYTRTYVRMGHVYICISTVEYTCALLPNLTFLFWVRVCICEC